MGWLGQATAWLREWMAQQIWLEPLRPAIERTPDWALLATGLALVALIVLAARWVLRQRRRPSSDVVVLDEDPPWVRRAAGQAPRDGNTEGWDAFISYKSENVELARRIADRLIASGRRVWFAEYQVLLAERGRFQEAIDRGLDASRYGIAVTSDLYADSEHCRNELSRLLARCGVERIIDVRTSGETQTQRLFPALARSHAIEHGGDAEAVLARIGKVTGWPIVAALTPPPPSRRRVHEGRVLDVPYSIDVSGWTLVDPSFQGGGPCYQHDQLRVIWNLQYGSEYNPSLYEARRAWTKTRINDRALFEEMCEFARGHFDDPVGVHLIFQEGVSHFAATYRRGDHWKRRYSIMLVEPQTYKAAEFAFTFQFDGTFARYCLLTEAMDAIVRSLRWRAAGSATVASPSAAPERMSRLIDDIGAANKLYDEGMTLMKRGRMSEGLARLERVLDYSILAEMRSAVQFNMGLAHERLGNIPAAIASYEACVATNPGQFNALCNLGGIHHRRGDVQAALSCFLKAAEISPKDYTTVNNIVICYKDLGDTENAQKWLAVWRGLKQ